MKLKVVDIDDEKNGKVYLNDKSTDLEASKRSILFAGVNVEVGDVFEMSLKKINKQSKKKPAAKKKAKKK